MADITDRSIIEENLKASEKKLQQLIANMAESFYVVDRNYCVTLINKVAESNLEKTWKYPITVGTNILDHILPEKDEPVKNSLNKVFAGETFEYELCLSLRDLPSWLLVTSTPVYDESKSIIGACIVTRDITERKKADERLKETASQLSITAQIAKLGYWEHDLTKNLFTFTDQFYAIFKTTAEKVGGYTMSTDRYTELFVHPEDSAVVGEEVAMAIQSDDPYFTRRLEHRIIYANGEVGHVSVHFFIVKDDKGRTVKTFGVNQDITDRKKAEDALQQSNNRFELITSTTNDAVWEWNLETGELWSNEMHQHLYGLTLSDPVPAEKMWAERIHPDDRQVILKKQKEALASDKNVFISEYRFKVEEKNYRDIYDRCYIVRNKEGKPVRMMGSMMDITERKRTEEQLRESEERYRSLIEQASDAIMITDEKGNFIDINSSFCNMFGYIKNELLQLNIRALIDPEQLQKQPMRFEELKGGKQIFSQRRMLHKNGTIIEVEANVKMLPDGRVLAIARDITDRKKAEEAIRISEETRRLIMNSALDAIVCMNNAGIITVWTPQAEKIFGWKEREIIGKNLADTIIPVQYRKKHIAGLKSYLKTGEGPVLNKVIEITAIDRHGKEFPVELSIIPIKQGETEFFCAFIRDITQRKLAEEAINKSEVKYRTLVEQAGDAIAMFDRSGKLIDVNTSATQLLHYTKEELTSMNLEEIFFGDELEKQPVIFDVLENGESSIRQRYLKRKDGSPVETEVHTKMLPDGHFLSVVRDLTERNKARQQIEKEKNLSDSVINSLPGVFFLQDRSGKFLRWNKEFEIVSGYNSSEIGKLKPTDFYEEKEKAIIINKIEEVFAKGFADIEITVISKYGKKIPFYFKAQSIQYEGKTCLIGTGVDITERKKAQVELEQSYKAIRQLTEHVQNIREEERIGIAREIHDELGQQLTVMKMDLSWLNKKMVPDDEAVKQKLKGLTELLDGTVKTVRRISSELRPSLLDDMGLIAAIEWQLNEFEQRSGIRTSLAAPEMEKQLPDSVRTGLFRIFQESLTNIARHASAKEVKIRLQHKEGKIVLSIEDDGKGFDKKKTAAKRTLGILGMRERTLMMGGEYEIKSIPGQGTTVLVAIPEQV